MQLIMLMKPAKSGHLQLPAETVLWVKLHDDEMTAVFYMVGEQGWPVTHVLYRKGPHETDWIKARKLLH